MCGRGRREIAAGFFRVAGGLRRRKIERPAEAILSSATTSINRCFEQRLAGCMAKGFDDVALMREVLERDQRCLGWIDPARGGEMGQVNR